MWKLSGSPKIQHLGNSFYIVHNLVADDRVRIITSHWCLGKESLLIQTWSRKGFATVPPRSRLHFGSGNRLPTSIVVVKSINYDF